jgi:dihydroxyacetone kinase phosphotransfer subunit
MVGLLVVSHSRSIAEGIRELISETAPSLPIEAVGGSPDGGLGSDHDRIYEALERMYTPEGVIVLFDLGSSWMSTEIVIEELKEKGMDNIHIVPAALVEGAFVAGVEISTGAALNEVLSALGEYKLEKM